jgi:hypothetical protein
MFKKGDIVKYIGGNESYPVDSVIADRYLDKKSIYVIDQVTGKVPPYTDLKLAGIPIPMVSVLFKKVGAE